MSKINTNDNESGATKALDTATGYARFHGNGGYENQQKKAKEVFSEDQLYKVTGGCMYGWNTELEFEGIEGKWNSALFDVDLKSCPISHSY